MSWLTNALQAVVNGIVAAFQIVLNWIWTLLSGLLDHVVDLISFAVQYIVGLIPDGVRTSFETIPWASMYQFVDDINWFIPIYGLMATALGTYGLAGTVRLGRWIKSFIPTISG